MKMEIFRASLAALILAATAGAATAANSVYANPDECKAQVGSLDANTDGFVSADEVPTPGVIQTNVDTDGDGKISQEEMVVACDNELLDALKPKD